jgi:hypothetical protein
MPKNIFPWPAVLLVGHVLSCRMPHPENPLNTLVSEVMELVPELVELGLDN